MKLFLLYPFVIAVYLIFRFVLPMRIKSGIKTFFIIVVIIFCLRQYWYIPFGGTMLDQMMPRPIVLVSGVACLATIVMFALTVLRDFINFAGKIIKWSSDYQFIAPGSLFFNFLFFVAGVLIGVYGVMGGISSPRIERITVELKTLPKEAEGYRIVYLTDLHISKFTLESDVSAIVKRVNVLKPNLILLGGDYQDGKYDALDSKLSLFKSLYAKDGVYAVSGNNEFYHGYKNWKNYYENIGIRILDNTSVKIGELQFRKFYFNLAGVMDEKGKSFGFEGIDADKALRGIDPSVPTIMLCHQPAYAEMFKNKVDLILSGHTHGGMLPILKTLTAKMNKGFVSGIYYLDNTQLLVSNGTMVWEGFPLRINTPLQIYEITLKSGKR